MKPHSSPNQSVRQPASLGTLAFALILTSMTAAADNGRLEINQECAEVGCFAGDGANFPVTISQSGSYVLTGNLSVSGSFVNGLEIAADGVTLDLNGFTVQGSDDNSSVGISIEANHAAIYNGTVRDFTFGVNRQTPGVHGFSSRVKNVTIHSNVSVGIRLGPNSLLTDCSSIENGQQGIAMDDNGIVRGCTSANNGTGTTHAGISMGTNALVSGNTVVNNQGDGIFARAGSVVENNTVTGNGDNGIEIAIGSDLHASVVRGNTSSSNTNYGIASTGSTLITNNAANNNRTSMDNTDIQPCVTCVIIENLPP